MSPETRLILGCGYLGRRVARAWQQSGHTVYAVTRSAARAESFRAEGLRPVLADVTRPETLAGLPPARLVLNAVGYDRHAAATRHQVYVEGLRAVLAALPPDTKRIIHISSTGVYGQSDAAWVDEDTPCQPTRPSGAAMWAAEQVLAAHPLGQRAMVLRLAGLYGPGRIPRVADLQAGRPMAVSSRGHLNLIHVSDAVRVVLAAETVSPPRTYLVSDGHPAQRRPFYLRLAELLGLPPPQFVEPSAADAALSRAGTDKQVSNRRMLAELKVQLAYPSYREGLAAIVAEMRGSAAADGFCGP